MIALIHYLLSTALACVMVFVTFATSARAQGTSKLEAGIERVWHSDYNDAQLQLRSVIAERNRKLPADSLGIAYMYLGRAEQLMSVYDSALIHLHRAQAIFNTNMNADLLVECKAWLAEYYRSIGEFETGMKYLRECELLLSETTVSDLSKAIYYTRSAAYSNELGRDPTRKEVLYFSELAYNLAVKMKHLDLQATAVNEIGFAHENRRDVRAMEYYLNAYELWKKSGNRHYATNSLINVVRESIKRKNYDKAVYYAHIGYRAAEEDSLQHARQIFASQLMQAEEKRGNLAEALYYSHVYHDLYEIEMGKRWSRSIVEVERKYDLVKQQKKTESERARAELALSNARRNETQRNYLILLALVLAVSLVVILVLLRKLWSKNRDLEESLNEKKMLLKEVYHRVKNNLAFLNGLLFLRARSAPNEAVKVILSECQSRIHSMSILHQQLYQDGVQDSGTSFKEYCTTLLSDLRDASVGTDRRMEFEIFGNISGLNLNRAVLVGLIINELAMNSIKHAFVHEVLKIKIQLLKNEEGYAISYADNGPGLPDGVTLENDSGFGFRMIRLLIRQLNSTIQYRKEKDCLFHIQMNDE